MNSTRTETWVLFRSTYISENIHCDFTYITDSDVHLLLIQFL